MLTDEPLGAQAKCAMKGRGKTIRHLDQKLRVLADILCAAGVIPARSLKALAGAAQVKYRTLQSSTETGRVSAEVESRLCELSRFTPHEPAWCDLTMPDAQRGDVGVDYSGRDDVAAFRRRLEAIWSPSPPYLRAVTAAIEARDPDFACHQVGDGGQATAPPADFLLLMQATFGSLVDRAGIRYGFRRARLRLSFSGGAGLTAVVALGQTQPEQLRNAQLVWRGTDSLPCWEISCTGPANDVLDGEYRTTDAPLANLAGYSPGDRIDSVLYASLYDGSISVEPTLGPLSANKAALLELVCSLEIAEGCDEYGRVDLCTHSIVLTGCKNA